MKWNFKKSVITLFSTSMILGLSLMTQKSQAASSCYASTVCYDGRVVSCRAYGNGCTFQIINGYGVQCTGYDLYYNWLSFWSRC